MANIKSKRLAIYYGWPSAVNGTFTVEGAIDVFKAYGLVVFGSGLENDTHPDHVHTMNIIAGLVKTDVFGYVDSTLPFVDFKEIVDRWAVMGVKGVFCDRFGYDFGVTREGQSDMVNYVHSKALSAFVNAWNPDDAFAPEGNGVTALGKGDWFLAESYQIAEDEYENYDDWVTRSEKLVKYGKATGVKIAGVTTTASGVFDQGKFDYAYFSALIYGFDAFGWGEQFFSAPTSQLPFRQRKKFYGNAFTSDLMKDGGLLKRTTNVGIEVNTVTRTVDYLL